MDQAGLLPNSQSPKIAEDGAVMVAMLHQRRSDWMVNIAHFQVFIG
jgi:hypothetical protein